MKKIELIHANIKFIRKQKGMTQDDFANLIGIKRSALGSYEEGRAKPSYETLEMIAGLVKIPIGDLLKINLSDIADKSVFGGRADIEAPPPAVAIQQQLNVPTTNEASKLRILAITVDKDNNENIELVPVSAAAGYLQGHTDTDFIAELPKFRLPFLPQGTYRAFEIKGDSMLPLPSGSVVVGEFVENAQDLRTGQTYILLCKGDTQGLVYKRVVNTIDENGTIILRSDNTTYPPYRVKADDILEAWRARTYISKEMPNNEATLEKVMSNVIELQQEMLRIKEQIRN